MHLFFRRRDISSHSSMHHVNSGRIVALNKTKRPPARRPPKPITQSMVSI